MWHRPPRSDYKNPIDVLTFCQAGRSYGRSAMYEGLLAETIRIEGHNGDVIDAYFARPLAGGPYPSVVVVHHMPGWDEATKEIVRKFAHHGYVAICPNLHHRVGPGSPDDQAAAVRAQGGNPDAQFLGDANGAIDVPEPPAVHHRQDRHDRILLGRAPDLHRRLQDPGALGRRRLLGRARDRQAGGDHRAPAGRARST